MNLIKLIKRLVLTCLLFNIFIISGYGQHVKTPVTEAWENFSENKDQSEYSGLKWTTLGPVINSGRVESIDVVPGNPGTIYVGFGSGNLWKTINHGFSWKPIFDDNSAYSIGDVCIAPSNSDIVYLGTGENLRAWRGHTIAGSGVYRSDDAGESWTSLGLEDSYHIGRVAVHPTNSDIVLVAALGHFYSPSKNRGVYRSDNGGKSWEKVLYVDDRTGANDIVISQSNPQIMYASTWTCSDVIGGAECNVFKSTDGGKTWKKIGNGLPDGEMNGRIGLAVSHQDSDKVYAFTDNLNKKSDTGELYRTDNGGDSWTRTHKGGLKILSSFGHVFTDCFINPQDDNEVYVVGINILRSSDGGKSFIPLRGKINNIVDSPADFFHVDHHDMWINPDNPDHIMVGNDGGFYISYDKAESWFHYNNIPVGEFYFIRTDNNDPYNIYGGTQDDAAVYGPAVSLKENTNDLWNYVWIDPWGGGDGVVTCPDPEDSDIVYYESQNGAIRRKNMFTGESVSIRPRLPEENGDEMFSEWLTPYFVSEYNHTTLYYGANYVFKSVNRGNDWEVISPNLSKSDNDRKCGEGITAIKESQAKRGLLFAGTAKGAVWVSKDDGSKWLEISDGLPNNYVKAIYPSAFKESRVYICLNGIKNDDFTPMVYLSDDYGASWTDISSNLPEAHVNSILEDPVNENILYVGTFNGVFISTDMGKSWNVLGTDMPNCFVTDMTIQQRALDLIVATHGRGIYKIDLEPVHKYVDLPGDKSEILFLTDAYLPLEDASGQKSDFSSYEGLRVDLYLEDSGEYDISVTNSEDDIVLYTNTTTYKKGLNSFSWNLVVNSVDNDNPYLFKFSEFAKPGKYIIIVEGKNTKIKSEFYVVE